MNLFYFFALTTLSLGNTTELARTHKFCWQNTAVNNVLDIQAEPIPTNSKVFKKSEDAKQYLKSKVNAAACYVDIKKWTYTKSEKHEAEFVFNLKTAPIQALMLCEKNAAPLLIVRDAVVSNIQKIVPDAKITHQEYRTVNGQSVIQIELIGTVQSVQCMYWGYISNASTGSTTWLGFGTYELMNQHKAEVETLLNGLVKQ